MTPTDIAYRYGRTPGMAEMRAISAMTEVYGVRKVSFDEAANTVRVEFDASRMNEENVAALLRRAGLDLTDRLTLA
jgi:copper chaperone CopZ